MTLKRLGIIGGILAGTIGVLGYAWYIHQPSAWLRLPGTVEIQEVRLSSRVGGRVESVLVQEGDLVEGGQPLVHFDIADLRAQRDQVQSRLLAAQATHLKLQRGARSEEKASARAAADSSQARYERVKAGFR